MQQTAQRLLLLGILFQGKMHGYGLNEHVDHAMGLYTDVKKSTVYYTLEKLEKEGCVAQETEREGKRPERRVYRITEEGRTHFIDLLREHLRSYERTYYADDIGVVFMDQLPTAEARQLLAEKRERIRASLEQLRGHPASGEHEGNMRHMLRHSLAHLEADLAWVDGILGELGRSQSAGTSGGQSPQSREEGMA